MKNKFILFMFCCLFSGSLCAQQKRIQTMIKQSATQDSIMRIGKSAFRINKDGGLLQNVRDTLTLQDTGEPKGVRIFNFKEFPSTVLRQVFSKERLIELLHNQNKGITIICIFDASGYSQSLLFNCKYCPDITPEEFLAIEKAAKAFKFNFTYSSYSPQYHRLAYICAFSRILQEWNSEEPAKEKSQPVSLH